MFAADNKDVNPLDLSIEENIVVPEVPKKAKKYVITAIDQLRRQLIKEGFEVEALRNNEVVGFIIPCSALFAPCETSLKPSADNILSKLGFIIRDTGKYKILVIVHSDDTGDAQYADSITAARANSIDDYFWKLSGQKETGIIPYGVGMDEYIKTNNSIANREANRRVEIIIIPDYGLLQMAGVKRK